MSQFAICPPGRVCAITACRDVGSLTRSSAVADERPLPEGEVNIFLSSSGGFAQKPTPISDLLGRKKEGK